MLKEKEEVEALDKLHRERAKWVTATWVFGVLFAVAVVTVFGLAYYISRPTLEKQLSQNGQGQTQPPAAAEQPEEIVPEIVQVSSDDDPFQGPQEAKVTVIEFSDFLCPFCAVSAGFRPDLQEQMKQRDPSWEAAVPKIIEKYIGAGQVKFVFRDAPFHGVPAVKAAEAAQCAQDQGKYWEMHDLLFAKQDSFPEKEEEIIPFLKGLVQEIGIDGEQLAQCLTEGKYAAEVAKDLEEAKNIGVNGTPSYFVNGRKIVGAQGFASFEALIEEELKK